MEMSFESYTKRVRWRRWVKFGIFAIPISLIAAHYFEKHHLERVTFEILGGKGDLQEKIIELCPQPYIKTTERLYFGPQGHKYKMRCTTNNFHETADARDYQIWFKPPYGRFAFQRVFGVSSQDYFESAWDLFPVIAKLKENGDIVWYTQWVTATYSQQLSNKPVIARRLKF